MSHPETAYCEQCHKEVAYHCNPVNHGKQLLISVITLGLWLPVWVCLTCCPTKLCDVCDNPLWSTSK